MKSPFPGMDPYLEARWSDVHVTLIGLIKEALQPAVMSRGLRARSEERVLLETEEEQPLTSYRSDVAVVDLGPRVTAPGSAGEAALATIEPVRIGFYEGPVLDRFIHIIDRTSGNRVITAIEVLSPWNKGPGRLNTDYIRKIQDYARGGVSLVEIDLLRHPPRNRLHIEQGDLPPRAQAPYLTCVRRAWDLGFYDVYPMDLRKPLPRIPIPLRPGESPVGLDLQPLLERAYVAGGHDDIDYAKPCVPPLEGEDAEWADQLLRAAGKR